MPGVTVGIIGCGNISDAYLTGAGRSKLMSVKAVADLRPEAAEAQAEKYNVQAETIDALLADPAIDISSTSRSRSCTAWSAARSSPPANTSTPKSPSPPTRRGQGGARRRRGQGRPKSARPDTFLGGGHQACRRAVDEGRIGRVVAGAATVMNFGMEHWHPNPSFFFKRGGGPVLDLGVYYITQLVNLLGPIGKVSALASAAVATRIVGSGDLQGQTIEVDVATTVNGLLQFTNGANVSLTTSWDVWKHRRLPFELRYQGSLLVPDPNFFGGTPMVTQRDGEWTDLDLSAYPFWQPNRTLRSGAHVGDYRIVGVLDMAAAITANRPHRADGAMALHVLEVMEALQRSSDEGRHIAIETTCERPAPLPLGTGEEVFSS